MIIQSWLRTAAAAASFAASLSAALPRPFLLPASYVSLEPDAAQAAPRLWPSHTPIQFQRRRRGKVLNVGRDRTRCPGQSAIYYVTETTPTMRMRLRPLPAPRRHPSVDKQLPLYLALPDGERV